MSEIRLWSKDKEKIKLAESLKDRVIKSARVQETSGYCLLSMLLDDGRVVEVGVSGNLYDEAYFLFQPITHKDERRAGEPA